MRQGTELSRPLNRWLVNACCKQASNAAVPTTQHTRIRLHLNLHPFFAHPADISNETLPQCQTHYIPSNNSSSIEHAKGSIEGH
jgi:EAL domain-containing protein (putative c-di-GMP-specific phosphodiesterase class I)